MTADSARVPTDGDLSLPAPVWIFLGWAFGISWGAFALRQVWSWPGSIDAALALTTKFGPSLGGLAAAVSTAGLRGSVDLASKLLRPPPRISWLVFATLVPVAILGVALLLRGVTREAVTSLQGWSVREALVLYGSLLAVRFFAGGGLGEELGWRGFMLPRLLPRVGPLRASLIIGVAHGLWHLPVYGAGVILFTVFTVAGAVVFTWMYERTGGNLLLPALMHASGNASLPWLETLVPVIDDELLFPVAVFAVWVMLAGVLAWRSGWLNDRRRGRGP